MKTILNFTFRQPECSCRPTFPQLVELLSRADFELFLWEEEDLRNSDPRVKETGAPLEVMVNTKSNPAYGGILNFNSIIDHLYLLFV